jgi:hypothetical protein
MYVAIEAVTQLRICEEGVDERTDKRRSNENERRATETEAPDRGN